MSQSDSVEDPNGTLESDDHMRDMERLDVEVLRLERVVPSVMRVTGRIASANPDAWAPPNQAVRLALEQPVGQRPVVRVYTIRRFDPVASTVEIDFVIHEDDSPAMRWLAAARPGTLLPMIGPRQHLVPQPKAGEKTAIFADETAIPAVFAMLSGWHLLAEPDAGQTEVWIETSDAQAFAELPRPEGVRLHLLLRGPDQPAGTTRRLLAAARALPDPKSWRVWASGERQEMRDLRNHFSKAGVGRAAMQVLGYWKLGLSGTDLDRVRLAEYEALQASGKTLEELSDLDLPV